MPACARMRAINAVSCVPKTARKPLSRRRQHRPRECEVVLVHVALFLKRDVRQFLVGALYEPDADATAHHAGEIVRRAMEVRLQADTNRSDAACLAHDVERGVDVGLCSMSTHRYVPHACACSASART